MADDDSTTAATQRPARRRAASRPAGPPEPLAGETPLQDVPADDLPAPGADPVEELPDVPAGPPASVVQADRSAQTGPGETGPGQVDDPEQPGEPAPLRPLSTALLFQAPDPQTAVRRPRRAASRPAGAPVHVEPGAGEDADHGDGADEGTGELAGQVPSGQIAADEPAPEVSAATSARGQHPDGPVADEPGEAAPRTRRGSRSRAARAAAGPPPVGEPSPVEAPVTATTEPSGGGSSGTTAPASRRSTRRPRVEPGAPVVEPGSSRRLPPGALAPTDDAPEPASDAPGLDDGPAAAAIDAEVLEAEVDAGPTGAPLASPFAVDLGDELDRLRTRRPPADVDDADVDLDEVDPDDLLAEDGDDDSAAGRRSRRRRGGRGRSRRRTPEGGETLEGGADGAVDPQGGAGDVQDDAAASGDELDDPGAAAPATDVDADPADPADADPSARRRRRRRGSSRGSAGAEAADDRDAEPTAAAADDPGGDVDDTAEVGRRRRSRSAARSSGAPAGTGVDDVTSIRGSTRLEAKRQRRRDGRDSGRRPKTISEAEFLARRESVERTMVVRSTQGRTQIAVLEDGVLVEHYVARKQHTSMIGDVYLGKVQNVLPSMEAAFVDVGRGRNAVLYAGEVNWEAAGLSGQAKRIETAMKSGDPVLVQVSKDPVGHKGARLTSQVSLPGRYLVYVPGGSMTGISRKLPDVERSRLKKVLREVVPEDGGVIVRTAAEGASEEELSRDVERLVAQWAEIEARAAKVSAPVLLHGEPDLTIKVVRDVFNEDFARLVVDGEDAWSAIRPYIDQIAPDLSDRVVRWDGDDASATGDAFERYRIDEQIAKALERKVWLPSGGSLVIDRTEAMTVVDVNTGRFTGTGGNLEETVTRNNLEAAEEIVRQLRLRDIGGIIVVDFIDMVLESNRDLVLRRLVECLGRDRTKHQVAEVTSLGLVQMTRKRMGQGLLEAFSETCEHCGGSGVVLHGEPLDPSGVEDADGDRGAGRSAGSGAGSASPSGASRPASGGGSGGREVGGPGSSGGREPGSRGRRGRSPGGERAAQTGAPGAGAVDVEDPAERARAEAARDAVRDAIHGVALASRLVPAGGSAGDASEAPDDVGPDVVDVVDLGDDGAAVGEADPATVEEPVGHPDLTTVEGSDPGQHHDPDAQPAEPASGRPVEPAAAE